MDETEVERRRAAFCHMRAMIVDRKVRDTAVNRRNLVRLFKIECGCAECGYDATHLGLDFDHVRGDKLLSIGGGSTALYTWDAICAEIEKCEVVCAICHRVRTARRLRDETVDGLRSKIADAAAERRRIDAMRQLEIECTKLMLRSPEQQDVV